MSNRLIRRRGFFLGFGATVLLLLLLSHGRKMEEATAGPRDLKAKFHQDFRTGDYDPELLFPYGQGELFRNQKGLAISFPAGEEKSRQDTGLAPFLSIRGDFEVTVSFEVLKAERPTTGDGVGPVLFIGTRSEYHATEAVSLARLLLPDGKTVFMADRLKRIDGKWTHQRKSVPATASAGKLRLDRQGTMVRFRVSEGDKVVTVAEVEFVKADLRGIEMAGSTGKSASGLDLRFLDFTVRAEGLLGLPDADEKRPAEPTIKRRDSKQLADLEAKVQKLYARLAPSVVHILNPKRTEGGFSGVIVSSAGEILTCAHHDLPPKTKVIVELTDGRKVKATMLGSVKQQVSAVTRYPADDVGLAIVDEKEDWPAAPLGLAGNLKAGDLCLALGQPNVHKPGQPPLLRLGRMLSPNQRGQTRTTCRMQPGDSGGPLFDLEGRVLGVHHAIESLRKGINMHAPVEGFLKLRDRLRAGEVVEFEKDLPDQFERREDPGGAWEPTEELRTIMSAAHKSTVDVSDDGKVIALGLIVDGGGLVLTKRSELTGHGGPRPLVCRLADGTQMEARVTAESREHDLALLRLSAKDLPAVKWGTSNGLGVGKLVASLGPGPQPLHYGVVGAMRVKNPALKSYLPISVEPAAQGMRGTVFTRFLPAHRQIDEARGLLTAGDLITHLDDHPTPSLAEFVRIRDKRIATVSVGAGEWIKLTVQREGKAGQVFLQLVDGPAPVPAVWQMARWNVRRNDFPEVFSHDGGIAFDRCGGPVVNRLGEVVGINIARADAMQSFAIPAEVIQRVVAELKTQARNESGGKQ